MQRGMRKVTGVAACVQGIIKQHLVEKGKISEKTNLRLLEAQSLVRVLGAEALRVHKDTSLKENQFAVTIVLEGGSNNNLAFGNAEANEHEDKIASLFYKDLGHMESCFKRVVQSVFSVTVWPPGLVHCVVKGGHRVVALLIFEVDEHTWGNRLVGDIVNPCWTDLERRKYYEESPDAPPER